ncbi:DUF1080 domain-containing protein [Luteitalea sp.]|uniref:3-keto-disaccharide hydrolase n=1 Tax=Luteitalea sp. TaxID=2004800 RepID=UPI0025BE9F25|nr:DUF1080 domain-containing protein [Luteitalea sp.]
MTLRTTTTMLSLGVTALLAGPGMHHIAAQAPKASVALFDGKTLSGWHKPQGVPADYRGGKWDVIDGALVGDQDPPGMGGFLVTDKTYRDYIIEFDVNLDEPADSGVFLRMGEDGKNHQLTLDNDQNKKFGDVYLSWGRETVHEAPEGKKHFRQGAWNTVKIQIQGEPARIRFWLNGVAVTDFQHTAETTSGVPKEGRIGLQIHAGKDWSTGSKVRFRNIRVTEL